MQDELMAALLRLPLAKATGSRTEVAVRCPYCEDSIKSDRPHFYIGMQDDVVMCHCKKCPANGLVTADTLARLGIHEIGVIEYIKVTNKPKSVVKINGSKEDKIRIAFPDIVRGRDDLKIQYMTERTGIDFSQNENIKSYKVVLNLNEFLRFNGQIPQGQPEYLNELSDSFVGFLSQNKNSISLRNVCSKRVTDRYQAYKIDQNKRAPFIYVPPCYIDPLTPAPKIVLAEGGFDVICVQKQFYPSDSTDTIFGGAGSKAAYKSALLHLVKMSGFVGADVMIYSDMDNRKKGYEPILQEFQEKIFQAYLGNFDFQVFFNEDEEQKDFGYLSKTWNIKKFSLRAS